MDPTDEERDLVAQARAAWLSGDAAGAAAILEGYAARRPDRRDALLALGDGDPRQAHDVQPVECLRCGALVPYGGRMRLHEGGAAREVLLGEWFVKRPAFDVYACGTCGHVELFRPDATRAPGPIARRA